MKRKVKMGIVIILTVLVCIAAVVGIIFCFRNRTLEEVPEQAATCNTDGHIKYYKSKIDVGTLFLDRDGNVSIDKSEVYDINSEIYKQTTTDEYGNEITLKEKYQAKGHKLQYVKRVEATCLEDGNIAYYHCEVCNKNYVDDKCTTLVTGDTIIKAGHKGDTKYKCEYIGNSKHKYFCENPSCPGTETEDCVFDDWTIPDDCTVSMDRSHKCIKCSEIEVDKRDPLTAHIWSDWEVTNATCTVDGQKTRECTVCKQSELEVLHATGHTAVINNEYWNDEYFIPSTKDGAATIPYRCSVCDELVVAKKYGVDEFSPDDKKLIRIEDKFPVGSVIMWEEDTNSLGLNLFNMDDNLTGFEYSGYNSSSHVLKLLSSYNGKDVKTIQIIGSSKPFSSLAITTDDSEKFSALTLVLENISYTAPTGYVGLDLSNVGNANLKLIGSVTIKALNGNHGVFASYLTISGKSILEVEGGAGANGSSVKGSNDCTNGNGKAGGIGINVLNNLTIDVEGKITIKGGAGGAAYDRPSGDNDDDGSDGRDGCSGGAGGYALKARQITINSGVLYAYGGAGGDGGNASECNLGFFFSGNVYGGKGGNGAAGGMAIYAEVLTFTCEKIYAEGGKGGDSGMKGGFHDSAAGSKETLGAKAHDGELGEAGSGGSAIYANCFLKGDTSKLERKNGNDGKVDTGVNWC